MDTGLGGSPMGGMPAMHGGCGGGMMGPGMGGHAQHHGHGGIVIVGGSGLGGCYGGMQGHHGFGGGGLGGCHGGMHGHHGGMVIIGGGGLGGCHGGMHGHHGFHGGCCGGMIVPGTPYTPGQDGKGKKPGKDGENGDKAVEPEGTEAKAAPAHLIVSLPADATLKIDGEATRSTSAERTFVTPTLPAGKNFKYTLEAAVKGKDGKPLNWSQKVTVKAGATTRITLTPPTGVASR